MARPMEHDTTTFTQVRFVIAVPNLQTSANFYRDVLGFRVREIGDDGWRLFERDNCIIMAGGGPDAVPPAGLGDHSYFAYIMVNGIEGFYRSVLEMQAEVIKSLRNEAWGMMEFGIRTIDG